MAEFFIALDVETANASRASICQIGMVAYAGTVELWRWESLVNPQEDFEGGNEFYTRMHGIGPTEVHSAPTFSHVYEAFYSTVSGQCIVTWGDFDQDAITQAATKYSLVKPTTYWMDACRVARVVWPEMESYKLTSMAASFGIVYSPHNALSDAETCAKIFQRALDASGTNLRFWLEKFGQRVPAPYIGAAVVQHPIRVSLNGREDGPLRGHVAIFTGDFSGGKARIEQAASKLGCDVKTSYSKHITICVVGNREPSAFGGSEKSQKHLQAEEAQQAGRSVSILTEKEFILLATSHGIAID